MSLLKLNPQIWTNYVHEDGGMEFLINGGRKLQSCTKNTLIDFDAMFKEVVYCFLCYTGAFSVY